MRTQELQVLVLSCERYRDLWTPFFTQFFKHWPHCPFAINLGTDGGSFESGRVAVIACESKIPWSACLLQFLEGIPAEYVLICLEDYFLRSKVKTEAITDGLAVLARKQGCCLRLIPRPAPPKVLRVREAPQYGVIPPGAKYRVSTQAAIWRKRDLIKLLVPTESAWDFEHLGTLRAESIASGFYGVYRSAFPYYHHVVERGEWFPWDAWNFGRMNIGCDFRARRIMSARKTAWWLFRKVGSKMLRR